MHVPIELGDDEARELLLRELSKAEYQNAKPTLIDRIAQAIGDWLTGLLSGTGGDTPAFVPFVIALGIVAAVIIIVLVVYGAPRRNRRTGAIGGLFGDAERRSAAELRAAARAAADRADWTTAIAEQYRATARGLAERELVHALPGTTAREFAVLAARVFPAEAASLQTAAGAFDRVRYLGRPGDRDAFHAVVALDDRLRTARPSLPELRAEAVR